MVKLRTKLNELPEQPGERRISVHWFFPLVALFYLGGGIACLREAPHERTPRALIYGGWALISLGLFVLLTFVLCVKRLRAGGKIDSLFTIRTRMLVLFGAMAGLMLLSFTLYRFLPDQLAVVLPFLWVFGGGFVWNRLVRYFQNHPPKN
jgi:hypothetical protein